MPKAYGNAYVVALSFLLFGAAAVDAAAQETPADTTARPTWATDLAARLSGSQVGYHNWTEGGINTLAATTALTGAAKRRSTNWQQSYDLRLGFGLVKQDTLAVRKSEDVIRLDAALQYTGEQLFGPFGPTLAASVRTQFAPGFNYDKNPFGDSRKPPVKVSDLFSPAAFTQSIGLTYDPAEWFTQRLGIAGKETVVLIERLRQLYGLEADQAVRVEVGVESRTQLDRELFENVRLRSSLGLFAAFNQPELPDALWENEFTMQVNRWLSVGFEVVSVYDRDIDRAVQFKEVLSVGVSVVIL